jgi:hypothetical protein
VFFVKILSSRYFLILWNYFLLENLENMSTDRWTRSTTPVHESTEPSLTTDCPSTDLWPRFKKVKWYSLIYSRSSVYGSVAMILFHENGIYRSILDRWRDDEWPGIALAGGGAGRAPVAEPWAVAFEARQDGLRWSVFRKVCFNGTTTMRGTHFG